jgi:hypothetical protein
MTLPTAAGTRRPITMSLDMARATLAAAEAAESAAEVASQLAADERAAGRATRGDAQAASRRYLAAIDETHMARERLKAVEAAQSAEQRAKVAADAEHRAELKRRAAELEARIGRELAAFDRCLTLLEFDAAALNHERTTGLTLPIAPPSAYRQAFSRLTEGLANLRANFPEPKED